MAKHHILSPLGIFATLCPLIFRTSPVRHSKTRNITFVVAPQLLGQPQYGGSYTCSVSLEALGCSRDEFALDGGVVHT